LNIVDLESGRIVRSAHDVSPGIQPVWSPNGKDVVVTRALSGNEFQGPIAILRVDSSGAGEELVQTFNESLGAYPVGFDGQSRLATVVLGSFGTSLHRTGADAVTLSSNLTRDWKLSPDGDSIAFVEVDTSAGVRYLARAESLTGATAEVSIQSLSGSVSALGTAWNPATNSPAFGAEPVASVAGSRIQSLTAGQSEGFDVPLGFSESGEALVVTHWSGESFQEPGRPQLQVLEGSDRFTFENHTRFFGWASR
jgi:hypothetical protein